MKTAPLPLHRLPLHNPGRLTDDEIVAGFVARRAQFDHIVADLSGESASSRPQHHLIVGQRGMGKTTLLLRLAAELRRSPLTERFVPLAFAEEQYTIDRLSKFWMNCLDSLADEHERRKEAQAAHRIDDTVRRLEAGLADSSRDEGALSRESLEAFLEAARAAGRRPVLLVDNVQLVFERIGEQQHALREVLQRPGAPILVAASPTPPPESQDYGAPFYDHFKTHWLRPLTLEEMRELLASLARAYGRADVEARVHRHPARLATLHQLTGGNPRTTVTLFHLYAEDFAPSVFADLEQLLDRVTPLYKARFEELAPQAQVVAGAMADHWDPITSRELGKRTGLGHPQISPQLDRLKRLGMVEEVELFPGPRRGYQLAERFFNVWYLMRNASRRQRHQIEFLTRFLESFYEPADRDRLARLLCQEDNLSPDRLKFALSLSRTVSDRNTKEELERSVQLAALHQRLEEILDLSQLPPATLAFGKLRRKIASLVPPNASVVPEDFAREVLGSLDLFRNGGRNRSATLEHLSIEEVGQARDIVRSLRLLDVRRYGKDAVDWFSKRLSDGQLRDLYDLDDWNRAFLQMPPRSPTLVNLMMATVPRDIAKILSQEALAQIWSAVEPSNNASAMDWFNWAHNLHVVFQRPDEAEASYRRAIEIDSKHVYSWNNLANLLVRGERYTDAETAFRRTIDLDPTLPYPWNNLGNLLVSLGRYSDAEGAYRRAIELGPTYALPWMGLGNLLKRQPERATEVEAAFRRAVSLDPNDAMSWNDLGNLLCDLPEHQKEAEQALLRALKLAPRFEFPRQNLLFLWRDYFGEGEIAHPLLEELSTQKEPLRAPDTFHLHEALFAAYKADWGTAHGKIRLALEQVPNGLPFGTVDDWVRATAVFLHLNYGGELLSVLKNCGYDQRLKPWYEALRTHHLGDPRHLLGVAAEVRPTAQWFYDQIARRLKMLPASTRRRPLGQSKPHKKPRRYKSGG